MAYHEVVIFIIDRITSAQALENEVINTQVKTQDILTASAEMIRDKIQMETNVEVAKLAVTKTLDVARSKAQTALQEASAIESTIKTVTQKKAESFAAMKKELGFTNRDIIGYMKANLIKDYPNSKMMINIT